MPEPFQEVRFPTGISLKSRGGPERRTEIVTLSSGHEQRNTRWADSRRRYDAGYGVRSLDDMQTVLAFFEQQRGRLSGFRWKDHADFKSCPPSGSPEADDQHLGLGDGAQVVFQLVKSYGSGPNTYQRTISKVVAGTVSISLDGILQTEVTDYTLDTTNGAVTFLQVPAVGAVITAGFEFDVPVRFDADNIEIDLEAFNAGQIPNIAIVEIKL